VNLPSGEVVELHACEVYTGGCIASGQATLGGRSLLRVWNFDRGAQNGIDLSGLQIAALQVADENLAVAKNAAKTTIVYLPAKASDAQRAALVSWLKTNAEFRNTAQSTLSQKIANIHFAAQKHSGEVSIKIGDDIALQTRALESCDSGNCGESLWYSPRSQTEKFTVLMDEKSSVVEPAVSLVWKDHGARSVFFGEFSGNTKSEPTFALAACD